MIDRWFLRIATPLVVLGLGWIGTEIHQQGKAIAALGHLPQKVETLGDTVVALRISVAKLETSTVSLNGALETLPDDFRTSVAESVKGQIKELLKDSVVIRATPVPNGLRFVDPLPHPFIPTMPAGQSPEQ